MELFRSTAWIKVQFYKFFDSADISITQHVFQKFSVLPHPWLHAGWESLLTVFQQAGLLPIAHGGKNLINQNLWIKLLWLNFRMW